MKVIKFYTKTPKIVQKYKQFSKKCKQFLNKSKTLSPYGAKKELLDVVVVSYAEQQSTNHKNLKVTCVLVLWKFVPTVSPEL